MNISDSEGESSCKRQENGDASNGSDRPLKKARFAWQVKGKYHLRNDVAGSSKSSSSQFESKRASTSNNNHQDALGHTEQNLERLGNYLLKQDFNSLDSVIADSGSSLLTPNSGISTQKIPYPRYISSSDSNSSSSSRHDSNTESHNSLPKSMIVSQSFNEDQCIARWQAKQMAKGFVDNTINRVLDSWMIAPLPAEMDNRILALDVAEFINNLPGDNSIENEGILMAISAHGLRNNTGSSRRNNDSLRNSLPSTDAFPSPPSSPTPSDENSELNKNHCNINNRNEIEMWSCNDVNRRVDNSLTPLSLYPDNSSSSYHCFNENYPLDSVNLDNEVDNPSSENDFTSHFDFMDAAVSFAIQNKGLTSFGSDYG